MSHLMNTLDQGPIRNDAPSAFFSRELERVKAQTYDVLKSPLKAFDLIPVDQTTSSAAESIVYQQFEELGMAKIISDYADDLPRADVVGREFIGRIKSLGGSYGYSLQEIRAAQAEGRPLQQRKANAVVRAFRETMNAVAFFGDQDHNLQGWLTNTNVPSRTASDTFDNLSNEDIVEEMTKTVHDVIEETNGVEQPDTLVMSIEKYRKISQTRMQDGTDTTILQFFQANNPGVTVEWAPELKESNRRKFISQADDPYDDNEIMIAYERNADKFWFEIPLMFEQLPVQERNLEFVIPCHARLGGVLMPYPLSQNVTEGI